MKLLQGDCLEQMKTLEDNSVDAIVSDPPYGISFMAKKWDYDVPSVEVWKEAMRVLKPGGHALIACGTRTQHRMVVNIEDAGFEIRDVVSWIYGSGFPKSLNISKAIDKAAGVEREVVGKKRAGLARKARGGGEMCGGNQSFEHLRVADITAPATEAAKQWDGWGTALKPSSEFFTLCRKPLSEKTIAANVLKWGTGGINIDGCRVGTDAGWSYPSGAGGNGFHGGVGRKADGSRKDACESTQGRFPANLIHDGSQEVLELFPETKSGGGNRNGAQKGDVFKGFGDTGVERVFKASQGSAARFFYCAKASKKDRDEGLEAMTAKFAPTMGNGIGAKEHDPETATPKKNTHPTVKPTALMQYLCRLITPTGGTVLDPYMGSGSTGKAAIKEGFDFIGCELDPDYFKIAETRINNEMK